MYQSLNLPQISVKLKGDTIWDPIRKKYFKCTPEEWVRQHFLQYLTDYKDYPMGRMVSEYSLDYNGMKKRCDLALFSRELDAQLIVECKAPSIQLTEDTFYQIAKYSRVLQAPLLILTNGLEHYCAHVDVKAMEMRFLKEIPNYNELIELIS